MKILLLFSTFIFTYFCYSQKIISSKTDQIDGFRTVSITPITIDSKYSKPPIRVEGTVLISPSIDQPSFYIDFLFPVKSPIFFTESDYAIIVLETGERIKPKYSGRIKTAGWRINKNEYFSINIWLSDLLLMANHKVSVIRIVTEEKDFDFDLNDSEANSFMKLIKLMNSIK